MKRYDEYIEINSPWIKNIPMNWNAKRLKSVAAYISRGETPVYTDDTSCTKVINQATFSQGYWNTKRYDTHLLVQLEMKVFRNKETFCLLLLAEVFWEKYSILINRTPILPTVM